MLTLRDLHGAFPVRAFECGERRDLIPERIVNPRDAEGGDVRAPAPFFKRSSVIAFYERLGRRYSARPMPQPHVVRIIGILWLALVMWVCWWPDSNL